MRKRGWLAAVCGVLCLLTACGNAPEVTVEQIGTTQQMQTTPTVAVPEGQLTVPLLMRWMSAHLPWSGIRAYTHIKEADNRAVFQVADTYGKTFTLTVTYDEKTDTVSTATLSYGDTTVDITSGKTEQLRIILTAMNEG